MSRKKLDRPPKKAKSALRTRAYKIQTGLSLVEASDVVEVVLVKTDKGWDRYTLVQCIDADGKERMVDGQNLRVRHHEVSVTPPTISSDTISAINASLGFVVGEPE